MTLLPPQARSIPTLGLIAPAAARRFSLQRCGDCDSFLYPVRDICPTCLSQNLTITDAPAGGTLLSETTIAISSDPFYRSGPPVRQGLVQADCGVTVIAMLHRDCPAEGRIRLSLRLDSGGKPVMVGMPEMVADKDLPDDPVLVGLSGADSAS